MFIDRGKNYQIINGIIKCIYWEHIIERQTRENLFIFIYSIDIAVNK